MGPKGPPKDERSGFDLEDRWRGAREPMVPPHGGVRYGGARRKDESEGRRIGGDKEGPALL